MDGCNSPRFWQGKGTSELLRSLGDLLNFFSFFLFLSLSSVLPSHFLSHLPSRSILCSLYFVILIFILIWPFLYIPSPLFYSFLLVQLSPAPSFCFLLFPSFFSRPSKRLFPSPLLLLSFPPHSSSIPFLSSYPPPHSPHFAQSSAFSSPFFTHFSLVSYLLSSSCLFTLLPSLSLPSCSPSRSPFSVSPYILKLFFPSPLLGPSW